MGAYSTKCITCSYIMVPSLYWQTLEIELFVILYNHLPSVENRFLFMATPARVRLSQCPRNRMTASNMRNEGNAHLFAGSDD